jgi:hypothetical protein
VGLAEDIQVKSVEIARQPVPDGTPSARLLKGWRLKGTGNDRTLQVDFHRPVPGTILLILELVPPLRAGPGPLTLSLPGPREARSLPGYVGYRIDGTKALPEAQHLRVTSIKPTAFAQRWRQTVRKSNDPGPPTLAYSFLRTSKEAAAIRITLAPPAAQVRQEVFWQVRLGNADVRARATLTAPTASLVLVEWEVPGVTVAQVTGPDVWDWTQTGSRVQVWLKSPCAKATIELGGWLPLPGGSTGPKKLSLPALRFPGTEGETKVGVAAVGGLAVNVQQLRGLDPVSRLPRAGLLAGSKWVYTAQQPLYGADLVVWPARANVRVLTRAEARDRQMAFASTLEYEVTRGELRTLRIRLRGWAEDKVHVEAPGASQLSVQRLGRSERIWTVSLPPGVDSLYAVKLTGQIPLDSASIGVMPDIADVSTPMGEGSVTHKERWLALAGRRLAAMSTRGLVPLNKPPPQSRLWKDFSGRRGERLSGMWTIASDQWQLRILQRPATTTRQLAVLLDEQSAAVADGRRWLHQAVYWLYLEAATDLRIDLPAAAAAVALAVDGAPQALRQVRPDQVPLSLTAGPRALRVTWVFPDADESLDRPNLARPRLVADGTKVTDFRTLWTVHVPAGYRIEGEGRPGGHNQSSNAAERDMRRADALGRLTSLLAEKRQAELAEPGYSGDLARPPLLTSQEWFLWYWQRSSYQLGPAAKNRPQVAVDSRRLADSLAALRRSNVELLKRPELKAIGDEGEKRTRNGVLPPGAAGMSLGPAPENIYLPMELTDKGLPTFWKTDAKTGSPRLQLGTGEEEHLEHGVLATVLVLLPVLAAWALSFVPQVLALLQKTWPEQIVVLGVAAWLALGLPSMGIAVMVLGGLARLFLLVRWVAALAHPATAAATPPGGSTASS